VRGSVYKSPLYLVLLEYYLFSIIGVGTVMFTLSEKVIFIQSCENLFCDVGFEIEVLYN
jgi:hypothetical protein